MRNLEWVGAQEILVCRLDHIKLTLWNGVIIVKTLCQILVQGLISFM